jgi:hypothetical protein
MRDELRRDLNRKALLGRAVVDDAVGAVVAVLPEEKSLNTELDSIALPDGLSIPRWLATLVIDRSDSAILEFDEIDASGEAESFAAEGDRASMDGVLLRRSFLRWRQAAALLVDALVTEAAIKRIDTVREFALHPLKVTETGTVGILIEHTRRQKREIRAQQ